MLAGEGRRRILITGAAGLIGSELCGQLADRGHAVVALVHRTHRLVRNNGTILNPEPYAGSRLEAGSLLCATGDIRKTNLGLQRRIAPALVNAIDLVVHCAAQTNFALVPAIHQTVNVEGTSNVIRFAHTASGDPPGLVHVSTAYVSGERSGEIAENELDVGQAFANEYEETKLKAEKLVRASGLQAAIARPSIIVGHSDTGAIGRFENLYAFLRLIGAGRITVLPAAPQATLDLVPIDHVIAGLIDIVENFGSAAGKTFHLVSGNPVRLSVLTAMDYPGFHVPRLMAPERFDPSLLGAVESRLYHGMTAVFAAYLRRDPRFVSQNLVGLSGRVCPNTGPGFLRRVVEFAKTAGYLQPSKVIGPPAI